MYLSHHYAVDLVGGGLIAAMFFYTVRARWLPQRQGDKITRWEYEYVEIGHRHDMPDEESGKVWHAGLLDHRRECSSDGWTLGSASSATWSSGSGTLSPTTSESTTPGLIVATMDSYGQMWDGATQPRDVELHEVVVVR